jgi:hypothetical protein
MRAFDAISILSQHCDDFGNTVQPFATGARTLWAMELRPQR